MAVNEAKDVRGTKYYCMVYITFNGERVMHITDVLASHEDDIQRHKNNPSFYFFELDRLGMTLNVR